MDHLRLDPLIDQDPDMIKAGWLGARVWELLLKVSGAMDLYGRIPPKYQDTAWLCRFWNLNPGDLPVSPTTIIEEGLRKLLEVRQVTTDGSDWVLEGWEEFYGPKPKTNAERQKDFRDRKTSERNESNARNESNGTPPTHSTPRTSLYPPPPNTAVADGLDCWGFIQEERRARGLPEEIRKPKGFAEWVSAAEAEHGKDKVAYALGGYFADEHFKDRGWPTGIFIAGDVMRHRLPVPGKVRL